MKKVLSVLMSLTIVFCCAFATPTGVLANTKKDALELGFNQSISVSVSVTDSQAWLHFTAPYSGYFEFVCHTPVTSGMMLASIYEADEEVLMMNSSTAGDTAFITAAELEAGEEYYFVLETDGTPYATLVSVGMHNHVYNSTETYPAVCDANDSHNSFNGGSYTFCAYCSNYITSAVYYAPAKIVLKYAKMTYTGKAKKNSVTVYDTAGNVIDKSNYTVKYKNNVKPGKSTVTVTFNNVSYSGTLTKTYNIIPKKGTLSSVSSPKKKSIKIKWKKDSTVSGYQFQYSTSKKFYKSKTTTKTVSKKRLSVTLKKLKSKKKYYVRVRSYKTINGKKVYGKWSSVKSVRIK